MHVALADRRDGAEPDGEQPDQPGQQEGDDDGGRRTPARTRARGSHTSATGVRVVGTARPEPTPRIGAQRPERKIAKPRNHHRCGPSYLSVAPIRFRTERSDARTKHRRRGQRIRTSPTPGAARRPDRDTPSDRAFGHFRPSVTAAARSGRQFDLADDLAEPVDAAPRRPAAPGARRRSGPPRWRPPRSATGPPSRYTETSSPSWRCASAAVVAGGLPLRLALDTAIGPTSRSRSSATGCSGIRTITVPLASPRSQLQRRGVLDHQGQAARPERLDQRPGDRRHRHHQPVDRGPGADQHRYRHVRPAALGGQQRPDGRGVERVGADPVDGVGRHHHQIAGPGGVRRGLQPGPPGHRVGAVEGGHAGPFLPVLVIR